MKFAGPTDRQRNAADVLQRLLPSGLPIRKVRLAQSAFKGKDYASAIVGLTLTVTWSANHPPSSEDEAAFGKGLSMAGLTFVRQPDFHGDALFTDQISGQDVEILLAEGFAAIITNDTSDHDVLNVVLADKADGGPG